MKMFLASLCAYALIALIITPVIALVTPFYLLFAALLIGSWLLYGLWSLYIAGCEFLRAALVTLKPRAGRAALTYP